MIPYFPFIHEKKKKINKEPELLPLYIEADYIENVEEEKNEKDEDGEDHIIIELF
jgi:hypothetical protein